MAVAHTWTVDTPDLFTARQWDWANQAWLYLLAEVTPGGGWDWAVWSSNSSRSLAGVAADQASAMAQAEQAAALIRRVRMAA